jgi:hypothetical protein
VKSRQVVSLGLPGARRCVGTRGLAIRLRAPRGVRLRSARVTAAGRRFAVRRRDGRLTARVRLRGRSRAFTVVVRAVAADGTVLRDERQYRTCARG